MTQESFDLDFFHEIFRKVRQERDHYRAVADRLQGENEKLQDNITWAMEQSTSFESWRVDKKAVRRDKKKRGHGVPAKTSELTIEGGDSPTDTGSVYSKNSIFYPFYRAPCPDNQLNLSLERLEQCLQSIARVPCDAPEPSVTVSRHFLSTFAHFIPGGIGRQKSIDSSGRTNVRRLLMGTVSAYFPTLFGSPGLLLSCRDEFLKSHHIWSCFSPTPNLNSKQLVYMGEYKLRFIDQLSQEEYDGQTDEAKKRNAYLIFDFIVRQLGPMQKYDKHFKHAGVSLLEAKFADGRERIRIFVIEHVGYDSRFAQVVQTQYDDWEEKQMKERGAAMGENDGTETTEEE